MQAAQKCQGRGLDLFLASQKSFLLVNHFTSLGNLSVDFSFLEKAIKHCLKFGVDKMFLMFVKEVFYVHHYLSHI